MGFLKRDKLRLDPDRLNNINFKHQSTIRSSKPSCVWLVYSGGELQELIKNVVYVWWDRKNRASGLYERNFQKLQFCVL